MGWKASCGQTGARVILRLTPPESSALGASGRMQGCTGWSSQHRHPGCTVIIQQAGMAPCQPCACLWSQSTLRCVRRRPEACCSEGSKPDRACCGCAACQENILTARCLLLTGQKVAELATLLRISGCSPSTLQCSMTDETCPPFQTPLQLTDAPGCESTKTATAERYLLSRAVPA